MAASRTERKRAARMPARGESMAPTHERIARAEGGYSVSRDGQMRVVQAPLDRLYDKCRLAERIVGEPFDDELNGLLYAAGCRYRSDWFMSGLSGTKGIDYNAAGGARHSGVSFLMQPPERAAYHRALWRTANNCFTRYELLAVGGIVCDERTLLAVGFELTGRRRRQTAEAQCLIHLRSALLKLVRHYGLSN